MRTREATSWTGEMAEASGVTVKRIEQLFTSGTKRLRENLRLWEIIEDMEGDWDEEFVVQVAVAEGIIPAGQDEHYVGVVREIYWRMTMTPAEEEALSDLVAYFLAKHKTGSKEYIAELVASRLGRAL